VAIAVFAESGMVSYRISAQQGSNGENTNLQLSKVTGDHKLMNSCWVEIGKKRGWLAQTFTNSTFGSS
jgi:hypothetical protein